MRAVCLAAALLGLAACAKHPVQPPPAPPPAPEPVAEIPEDPVPLPDHKPAPPRPKAAPVAAAAPTEMAKLEPAPSALPPPAPVVVSAPSPIGLDQEAVADAYGAPASRSDAPPAIMWQYLAEDCVLDVYFYRDVETGKTHALYVNVKGDDQSDDRLRTCLTRIAQRNAGTGTGAPVAR